MTPEQNIYQFLAASATVTALVSTRIYPDEAPTNATQPYLVYRRISTSPDVTHDQHTSSGRHLDGCRFEIVAIGATALACASLILAVRNALEKSMGLQAIWEDERSIQRDENAQAYGRSADFLVWKDPD